MTEFYEIYFIVKVLYRLLYCMLIKTQFIDNVLQLINFMEKLFYILFLFCFVSFGKITATEAM